MAAFRGVIQAGRGGGAFVELDPALAVPLVVTHRPRTRRRNGNLTFGSAGTSTSSAPARPGAV